MPTSSSSGVLELFPHEISFYASLKPIACTFSLHRQRACGRQRAIRSVPGSESLPGSDIIDMKEHFKVFFTIFLIIYFRCNPDPVRSKTLRTVNNILDWSDIYTALPIILAYVLQLCTLTSRISYATLYCVCVLRD